MYLISEIGMEIFELQDNLAKQYGYKAQPPLIAEINMQRYIENLPKIFKNEVKENNNGYSIFPNLYKQNERIINGGYCFPIVSKNGTFISHKYDRIVIGHYGAFIEIDNKDVVRDNLKVKEGQEYRINDPEFSQKVKYFWYTTKDRSDCKLYYQQKGVTYADYQPDKWYISPYEVMDIDEYIMFVMDRFGFAINNNMKTMICDYTNMI